MTDNTASIADAKARERASDIAYRLREWPKRPNPHMTINVSAMMSQAADEITSLRAEIMAERERAKVLVDALTDLCASMEYWAGCDEGCAEHSAISEIMSSGGAWPSVSYEQTRKALAAYGDGHE